MTYLLVGFGAATWMATIGFAFYRWIEHESAAAAFLLFVLIALTIGAVYWRIDALTNKGPCLRYETGVHFNPATKSMARYRVCAERGEWIGEFE